MGEEGIVLGQSYVDTVTGVVGTAIGYWKSLYGTDQVLLESVDTTGRPISQWCEITRVAVS